MKDNREQTDTVPNTDMAAEKIKGDTIYLTSMS